MQESPLAVGARPETEGWLIVFAAFLCIVFMFGVPTMLMPVIYSPIIDEYGWSRTQVTLVATLKFGAGAVCGIFFGALLDRFSVRRLVTVSGILSGLGMLGFLIIDSVRMFYAMGLVMGLGAVSVMIAIKVLVSREFLRRQGFAVGTALLGTSVAGSFTPILTNYLIDLVGWRMAVAVQSFGIWFIALPAFLWIVSESTARQIGASGMRMPGAVSDDSPDFSTIVRGRTFWLIGLAVLLVGFVDQAMGQHLVLYLDKDVGLGRPVAAQALSLIFAISAAGKIGFGWLYDRLSVRGVMVCYFMLGLAVLLVIPAEAVAMLLLFCVVRGLSHGGAIVDIPVLAKHCFGTRALGTSIGVLTACVTLGFAIGPPAVGYLYDQQGSYTTAFALMIGLSVAAGVLLIPVRPIYWSRTLGLQPVPSEHPGLSTTESAPAAPPA